MNREGFVRQADAFFAERPCEDAQSAMNAILKLYDYVETTAKEAASLTEESVPWCGILFKIQQTMSLTPLRLFWRVLAQNDSILIRSCAKGNIAEASGEYFNDQEIAIISQANMMIMFNLDAVTRLQAEMAESTSVQEAHQLWVSSTQGLQFTPMLRIHTFDIGSPPQEQGKK